MRARLTPHPDSRCEAIRSFEADIARPQPDRLVLTYLIKGDIAALDIPPHSEPARTDALWRHTCFEAFLKDARGPAYLELNAAPSTEWASYRFSDTRTGMTDAEEIVADRFETNSRRFDINVLRWAKEVGFYRFQVSWHVPGLLNGRLNVTAVIVDRAGSKSYWALAHPPGPPDFHHPDCFVLDLPPPAIS